MKSINFILRLIQIGISLICGPYITYRLIFLWSELEQAAQIYLVIIALAGWYCLYLVLIKGEHLGF